MMPNWNVPTKKDSFNRNSNVANWHRATNCVFNRHLPFPHHCHPYQLLPHHPFHHRLVDLLDELDAGKCRTGDCRLNFSDLDDVFSFPGPLVVKTTLDVSTANGKLS